MTAEEFEPGEEALRAQKVLLDRAEEIAGIGSWRLVVDTGEVEWSDGMYRILDVSRDTPGDELLTRERERVVPEDHPLLDSTVAAALRGEGFPPAVARIRRSDGEVRFISVDARLERDAGDHVVAVYGFAQDITERRRIDEELQQAAQSFRATFEQSTVGMANVAPDGKWLRVNQRLCDMLGYTQEEMEQLGFADITHPDDVVANVEQMRRMVEGAEDTYEAEKRYVRRDGSVVWVNLSVSAVRHPGGSLAYCVSVLEDITDRKIAEEALEQGRRFVENILVSSPNLIYIYDLIEHRNVYANREVTNFLGYTPEQIEGFGSHLFEAILHPDDAALVARHHARFETASDDDLYDVEYRMKHSCGEWRWLRSRDGVFGRDESGRVVRIRGFTEDITERKRLEAVTQDMLTAVIDVVGNVSEMRDPYTAGHQRRVAELATAIAGELGMSESEIGDIRVAALMHDIGKMSVPAEILSKPTRLGPMELQLVQVHAEAGYAIMESAHMYEPIPQIVYQHHERLDGSGYPRGLAGDALLPGSRVLMVADVVEAMMSHRPYRAALGRDAALAEIEQGAGRLYDADVAAACARVFNERGFAFTEG